jgi:hypothetical protein
VIARNSSVAHEGTTFPERVSASYARFVQPAATGLPNWRVVMWFPTIAAFGALLLIAFGISGTSSGAHFLSFGEGLDPRVILGGPRLIRQDEWLVQQGWIISQFEQGFPAVNQTFPGGMDATVLMELPNWDWSSFFRPHMWGFLFLGLDVGAAWQWWVPALGLVIGAYLIMVTLVPRRSVTAALVAVALFFSPIFQWWYGPNAIWPTAWALLAMAGVLWLVRDDRRWIRVLWAVILGWLGVTMAFGLYVPFLVPPVLVFVFFFFGVVLAQRPWRRGALVVLLRSIAPIVVAGVAAVGVTSIWVITRLDTFRAIGSTVYPGERSDPTGQLLLQDPLLTGLAGAPWGQSYLSYGGPTLFGPNPSEAATVILFAVFVFPSLATLSALRARREGRVDWMVVGALVSFLVVVAYLLVPGWDAVARLLLLDRVPASRFRIVFAVLIPLFFALVAREVDKLPSRRTWPFALASGSIATGLIVFVLIGVLGEDPSLLESGNLAWPLTCVLIVATATMVFFRRAVPSAALSLLVASLTIGAMVNPVYRGVYDLNDTLAGELIDDIERDAPGTWVGVGGPEAMALVVESGVSAYSGLQTYPPEEMWKAIDPAGEQEGSWNRLAHVRWVFAPGEPVVSAPQRDALLVTFDPCSAFAQDHVDYILADYAPPTLDCLGARGEADQGQIEIDFYEVVPPESGATR